MEERISPRHRLFARARRRALRSLPAALAGALWTCALGCSSDTSERPAHDIEPVSAPRLDGSTAMVRGESSLDAGAARAGRKSLDAGSDARAVGSAAPALDARVSADAQASKPDAAQAMDFCGQALPVDPSASGVREDSVLILPAIEQHPGVNPRGPAVSAQLGTRVVWMFGETVRRGSSSDVVASNSFTLSNFDRPLELEEALPGALPPLSFVPEPPSDVALGPDDTLHYEIGSLITVGPTESLLFYSLSRRAAPGGELVDEALGTRVVRVKTDLSTFHAEPEPGPVFPASAPSMRSGMLGRDGNVYLYGCRENADTQVDCLLARAPVGSAALARAYQYRIVGGWSNDLGVAVPVLKNARPELSVSYNPYLRRYLAVSLGGDDNQVVLQTAERPEGPFTPLSTVALPAQIANSAYPFRAALEHPELSSKCGRHLLLTYLNPTGDGNYELRPVELELR